MEICQFKKSCLSWRKYYSLLTKSNSRKIAHIPYNITSGASTIILYIPHLAGHSLSPFPLIVIAPAVKLEVMSNRAGKNNRSLSENSVKMAANILRRSSFSIGRMILGSARSPETSRNPASAAGSDLAADEPNLAQYTMSQKSQEPESSLKPTFFLEPGQSIDARAMDYIIKVNKKNQGDLAAMSTSSPYIMPPPPRAPK